MTTKTLTLRLVKNAGYKAYVTNRGHSKVYFRITDSSVRRIGRLSFTSPRTPILDAEGLAIVIQKETNG